MEYGGIRSVSDWNGRRESWSENIIKYNEDVFWNMLYPNALQNHSLDRKWCGGIGFLQEQESSFFIIIITTTFS